MLKLYRSEKRSSSFEALYTGKEYKDANKIPEKLKIGTEITNQAPI
jgi:hypothetical protein